MKKNLHSHFFYFIVASGYAQPGGDPSDDPDAGLTKEAIEYEALKALYESTGGENWTNNSTWLQGTTAEDFVSWVSSPFSFLPVFH